jgi:hypothetical protein
MIIRIIFFITFLIFTSCEQVSEEERKQSLETTLRNLQQYLLYPLDYTKGDELPLERSSWILFNQEKWKYNDKNGIWGRGHSWLSLEDNVVNETGVSINTSYKRKSYYFLLKDSKHRLIYIGKWEYSPKFKTKVRLIGTDSKKYPGDIRAYFEEIDDKNKDIPYMKLQLDKINLEAVQSREPSGLWFSLIKWVDMYGYNAYYDFKTHTVRQAEE